MHEDLPVVVALPAPLDGQVASWVERDLGWQVVDGGGALAPVVALTDRPSGRVPWIAVTDGPPDGEQVRRHLTAGALDVVGWPHDRLRIPLLAAQAEHGRPASDPRARLTVTGAGGGAGTSTVALAIGGLLAWSGAAVLVSGGADLLALAGASPDRGAPDEGSGRATPGAGGSAAAVPGVAGLSVVGAGVDVVDAAWAGDLVVVDGGTTQVAEATLVVTRPDRSIERARASGRPVIVIGDGPLDARTCRRILGDALAAHLPASARVARAGLGGHVPTALPGSWLRALRTGLARVEVPA